MKELALDIGYKNNILYKGVKISIPSHGIISIMGDNGSGKSTLYKTLLGIIPPIKGNVSEKFSNKLAIVSDYVHLPDEVSVWDVLCLLGEKNINLAKTNYNEFHSYIMNYKSQRLNTLSSGQRRIFEIYTVLAAGKTMIVLDEASNSLDYSNRELFLKHVKKLASDKILFFHTSHEIQDVVYLGGLVYGLFKSKKEVRIFTEELTGENLQKFMGYGER